MCFESKRPAAAASATVGYHRQLHGNQSAARGLLDHPVLLVSCCTVVGAAAQIFFKLGANNLAKATPIQMLTNPLLLVGYSLYAVSTVLLVLALRRGQLSILYPIISLTYVWVALLSMLIFKETLNTYKAIGLAVVVAGVAVLGRDSRT
jgi:multidrug transporter EmrE-like cation transporter